MAETGHHPGTHYTEQGGARRVVPSGASLDVESGGEIDVESGASLKIAGTAMQTAIAALAGKAMQAVCAAPTAESSEARTVSIQLNDHAGNPLAVRAAVMVYVSTDEDGDEPGDGDATITLSAGTDGALIGADESGAWFIAEADGDLDVVLTDGAAATETVYLHVVGPLGNIIGSSAAVAFAA